MLNSNNTLTRLRQGSLAVQTLSAVIIAYTSILCITKWLLPVSYNNLIESPSFIGGFMQYVKSDAENFTAMQKIFGFLVDFISIGLIVYALILVIKLMDHFKSNEFFSAQILSTMHSLTKIALIYACYAPIKYILLSVITTYNNKPGERVIALAIGNSDVINILIFCLLFLILSVVRQGHSLKQDQDLTI